MNKLRTIAGLITLTLVLGACGSSNSVVSNGFIQKRKYNKGFFIKSNSHLKSSDEELANNDLKGNSSEAEQSTLAVSDASEKEQRGVQESKASADNKFERKEIFTQNEKEHAKNVIHKIKDNKLTAKVGELTDKVSLTTSTEKRANNASQNYSAKASSARSGGGMSTGEIVTLIVIIIVIILLFTLLDKILGGTLSYILGIVLLIVLIYLLLRWLGVI